MNIQELEDEHRSIEVKTINSIIWQYREHSKLSIQFAIEMLEEINVFCINDVRAISYYEIHDKIEELKKYL